MYYRPLLVLSLLGITAVAFLRVAGEEVLMLSLAQQTFMTDISLDLLVLITRYHFHRRRFFSKNK